MNTPIEHRLQEATDEELRDVRRELQLAVMSDSPYTQDWHRLLRAVQAEIGRRTAAATPPGCCSNCAGTGRDAGAPETGGLCWDCRGTGHDHADLEPTDQCPAVE